LAIAAAWGTMRRYWMAPSQRPIVQGTLLQQLADVVQI
jgi:hypothetical protein